MTTRMQIALIIGIIVYTAIILHFIKKKTISLKYALLWLLSALVLLIVAVFPNIIYSISDFLGFVMPINAIYLIIIFFILLILISLSAIVTKQHYQIKKLTQILGILQKDVESLKNQIENIE